MTSGTDESDARTWRVAMLMFVLCWAALIFALLSWGLLHSSLMPYRPATAPAVIAMLALTLAFTGGIWEAGPSSLRVGLTVTGNAGGPGSQLAP